ncbi:transposase, partial [Pseudomonas aeruginosa]
DVQTYAQRGKQNDFPLLKRCPHCQAKRPRYRHGYYERNAVTSHQSYRIWIARYRCPECRRTVAVLPSFLLPYFQYTLPTIWRVVKERLGLT